MPGITCNRSHQECEIRGKVEYGGMPEDVVGFQEHAHARNHPRHEPPEVGFGAEGPGLCRLLVSALQQRARQPLVLRAACGTGSPSRSKWTEWQGKGIGQIDVDTSKVAVDIAVSSAAHQISCQHCQVMTRIDAADAAGSCKM